MTNMISFLNHSHDLNCGELLKFELDCFVIMQQTCFGHELYYKIQSSKLYRGCNGILDFCNGYNTKSDEN